MRHCLYRDGEWIAIFPDKPSVHELDQLVKDREMSVELLHKKRVKNSGVEFKLIKQQLGEC